MSDVVDRAVDVSRSLEESVAVDDGTIFIKTGDSRSLEESIAVSDGTVFADIVSVTLFDGNNADIDATKFETSRKVFKNPRGNQDFYVFYQSRSGSNDQVKYAWSNDGETWTGGINGDNELATTAQSIKKTSDWAVAIYDDGSQLIVTLITETSSERLTSTALSTTSSTATDSVSERV